jgi:hypothetical protein
MLPPNGFFLVDFEKSSRLSSLFDLSTSSSSSKVALKCQNGIEIIFFRRFDPAPSDGWI